jgi:hypothetical protein
MPGAVPDLGIEMQEPEIKVGNNVNWRSQAAGSQTEKRGVVVAVIAGGRGSSSKARAVIARLKRAGTHRSCYGGGSDRDQVSYVVEVVTGGPKARKALYWPRSVKIG